jgi:hypothetical protein
LDAGARTALDVALGTAAAMGDERCGTEHLLFGVVATSRGDVAELAEVFALDPLRVQRSIDALRAHHCSPPTRHELDPPLSDRARAALEGPSLSSNQLRSPFDLLVGMLEHSRSGAATVLRQLGVRISEIRRLAELGAARLGRAEVKELIAALDRRTERHEPWWGPREDAPVSRVPLPNGRPVEIARSRTAVASLDALVAGPDGFGFTLTFSSRRSWVLPPVWEAREELVPGLGAAHRLEPDVVIVNVNFPDGSSVSNRQPVARWTAEEPRVALVRLGQRSEVLARNDRRIPERRRDSCEWWVWPVPEIGDLVLDLLWRSEAVHGSIRIDGSELGRNAARLRSVG